MTPVCEMGGMEPEFIEVFQWIHMKNLPRLEKVKVWREGGLAEKVRLVVLIIVGFDGL